MKTRISSRALAVSGLAASMGSMLVAPPVAAQAAAEGWHGFYAGGGASYSNVSVERPGSYCEDCYYFDLPSYDEGDGDFSFVAHVGYRVGRYFGVEAAWRDAGTIGWSKDHVWMPDLGGYYHNDVEFESEAPEVTILGIFPFMQRWEAYGRLGVALWSADAWQTLIDADTGETIQRHVDDDGVGAVVGIGLGVSLTPSWHVRFEYCEGWIDGDVLNVDSDTSIQHVSLEMQYRFGARHGMSPVLLPQPQGSPAPPQ